MNDRDDKINRLLHDAEHKLAGVGMATMMRDTEAAERMRKAANELYAEAKAFDPDKKSESWGQTTIVEAANGELSLTR